MERIVILGCAGCGKSTLAKTLGAKFDLPVYHLDVYYWKPGWVEREKEEFFNIQKELVEKDKWVLDGNYRGTLDMRLPRADTIIYLDYSRMKALKGVIKRYFKYKNKHRDSIAEGCTEKIDKEFLKWIWRFKKDAKPKIMEKIKNYPNANLLIFKNRHQLNKYLKSLEK